MNPNVVDSAAPRRAALLVHAMDAKDREWMLASLPPPQRDAMQRLLEELHTLGIPQDATLLDELVAAPVRQPAQARLASLDAAQVAALAGILKEESAELSVRLLAIHPWRWKGALLAHFPPAFAQAIEAAGAPVGAPALEAALCEQVLARLAVRKPAEPRRPRSLRRLWAGLARTGAQA